MATDYDITLTANIVFVEEQMRNNLSTALGTIFGDSMNQVFADMGKKISAGIADSLENDTTITGRIGKAIAKSIADHYPTGPTGPGGTYYATVPAPTAGGPVGTNYRPPGTYGIGGEISTQAGGGDGGLRGQAERAITETDIGQTVLGPLANRMGGGIWKSAFQSGAVQNYVGKLYMNKQLKQRGLTASTGIPTAPGGGAEVGDIEDLLGQVTPGASGPATAEELAGGMAGSEAMMAGPVGLIVAGVMETGKALNKIIMPMVTQTAKNYVGMIGGPGIGAGAAAAAGVYSMAGLDEVSQAITALAQSGLEFRELRAAVGQSAKAIYGYGMTTSTATDLLSYQYEILGTSTKDVTKNMDYMAGAALSSGMSVEQFTQSALQGAKELQAHGYGAMSLQAATSMTQGLRTMVPGMTDASKIIAQMPTTVMEYKAAAQRLQVPLSEIGPPSMGGPKDTGQAGTAYIAAEAAYAHRMFGANETAGVEYLQRKFGIDIEQAIEYYRMGGMGSPAEVAHQMDIKARRAAAIMKGPAGVAAGIRKWGGGIAHIVKNLPMGIGTQMGEWMESGTNAAAGWAESGATKKVAASEKTYGGVQLNVNQGSDGSLTATQGGLTVKIEPSDQFKATVFKTNASAEADYSMQKGSGLYGNQ